jgi:hypothetical protein
MKNYFKVTGRKIPKGKLLLSSMKGEKILLYTQLIKWYIAHDIKITKIYKKIVCKVGKPFAWFLDEVTERRRAGDKDENAKILGDTHKLWGNSGPGKTLENTHEHKNIKYVSVDSDITDVIRKANFFDLVPVGNAYEVKTIKSSVKMNRAYQVGIAVYQLAKLRVLEFVYDFLDKYIDRSDYEICYGDTDSIYIAISKENIDDLVRPELIEEFKKNRNSWLSHSATCNCGCIRTPGLFKIEKEGDGMYALTSKCTCVKPILTEEERKLEQEIENLKANGCDIKTIAQMETMLDESLSTGSKRMKISAKGTNKTQNILTWSRYKRAFNGSIDTATNIGFRLKDNRMNTYIQPKLGLSAAYIKRRVDEDGIHTYPLDI